jgi:hypothetical protein
VKSAAVAVERPLAGLVTPAGRSAGPSPGPGGPGGGR